jgi:thiamine biosynthesis lipoprotein
VTYSRFRADSLVSQVEREPGVHQFPGDAAALFDTYRRLYDATDGAMSPLVGAALSELGYDRAYRLRDSGRRSEVPAWNDAVAWDGRSLTTVRPVSLDIGAAGKGYLVDLLGGILSSHGIPQFTIDGSGDILHSGAPPLRVGLEHPRDATVAIGIALVNHEAICASASNRRAWGAGLHHIVDATTGLPTTGIIATWAIAQTALDADGLATALFFADPARLRTHFDFEWVRMHATGRVEFSPQFNGEIFT